MGLTEVDMVSNGRGDLEAFCGRLIVDGHDCVATVLCLMLITSFQMEDGNRHIDVVRYQPRMMSRGHDSRRPFLLDHPKRVDLAARVVGSRLILVSLSDGIITGY
jgi:hypothetical protein